MPEDSDAETRTDDPAEVYERQRERGAPTDEVVELLGLDAGDVLLDLGSGPGYPAIRLAERLSPGVVYATDTDSDALRYCRRRAAERGVANVRPVVTDATALGVRFVDPTPALAAFVLHHVDDPPGALASIHGVLPARSGLLILEYHPEGAGAVGPPVDRRLPTARVREWLRAAGFLVEEVAGLPEEKYAIRARVGSSTPP